MEPIPSHSTAILNAYRFLNPHTRSELLAKGRLVPKHWKSASLILIDVVGFTRRCSQITSLQVLDYLQRLFKGLDDLLDIHGVHKIDLMGDAYFALCNTVDHPVDSARFCLHAIEVARATPVINDVMEIRTAVHSGPVDAIVLEAAVYKYTLVGRTVSTVRDLEVTGMAGKVHCSQTTVDALRHLRLVLLVELGPEVCGGEASYFVSARRDRFVTDDETALCPRTLRFISVSTRMGKLFDYTDVNQLRTFRMLQGPETRMDAVQCALDQSLKYMCQTKTTVILYTRHSQPICVSITVRHSFASVVGVLIECVMRAV